ncbi:MAG TPA: bifunctional diaminohydroxyphosphoribosylaminopyrimidine deaminase/5-amino-6-(5-phosphoribosylamino)uracil reductase RibD, partial [Bacteroidales bacterium]|nr:bifunctional diaminohydroxyphosphoribosylaminopyrimidine deaminase/5-amino-6-(5-phosphoribosylamino)uracil reductase RibD [Bacteroidales bacterium]
GKTPPCAELIISHHIPRVIVGSIDPNPIVAGKGIELLRNAGCEVITGILENECEELNKRFLTYYLKKRPYIVLKWAETADGFIDKIRSQEERPEWISNQASRILVHKWRSEEQAIMVATNTALMDNPMLNVREWRGKNPVRIVIDNHLKLSHQLNLLDGRIKTIVYTYQRHETEISNVEFVQIPRDVDELAFITSHLHGEKIQSVIVEGGAKFITSLLERNLWDEARVFKGNTLFFNGVKAPVLNGISASETNIDGVSLKYYKNNH